MASVHRRPNSKYWHAAYFGPDGNRILRSTKQANHQSALAVAMEFERASKLARRGDLTEAQAREVLKDIMKRADIGETLQGVSIKSHFDSWLESKRARKSKSTGERYGVAVADFLETLGKRASKPLTSLTVRSTWNLLFESSHRKKTFARYGDFGRENHRRRELNRRTSSGIGFRNQSRPKPWNCPKLKAWNRAHIHAASGSENARGHGR